MGLSAEDLQKARHMRVYMLQLTINSDEPDARRAHWHYARQAPLIFTQRYVARVCPPLDFGAAGGQPHVYRQWLFKVLADMPPDSAHRLQHELELCVKEKLHQLARAQEGMTKHNH